MEYLTERETWLTEQELRERHIAGIHDAIVGEHMDFDDDGLFELIEDNYDTMVVEGEWVTLKDGRRINVGSGPKPTVKVAKTAVKSADGKKLAAQKVAKMAKSTYETLKSDENLVRKAESLKGMKAVAAKTAVSVKRLGELTEAGQGASDLSKGILEAGKTFTKAAGRLFKEHAGTIAGIHAIAMALSHLIHHLAITLAPHVHALIQAASSMGGALI